MTSAFPELPEGKIGDDIRRKIEMTPEDELRRHSFLAREGDSEYVYLTDALSAIARARQEEREKFERDANLFEKLQQINALDAQAFFWNYQSKKQRAKAIEAFPAPSATGEKE